MKRFLCPFLFVLCSGQEKGQHCRKTLIAVLSLACLSFSASAQVSLLDPLVFDLDYYLARNPDVSRAFGGNADAIRSHWVSSGSKEGRVASPIFDSKYYLSANPDLGSAFGDFYDLAAIHYLQAGVFEGRAVSQILDVRYYTQTYADIARAFPGDFRSAALHYLRSGMFEGRRASSLFDVRYYLSANADLRTALGTNYAAATLHWLMFGIDERRSAASGQAPVARPAGMSATNFSGIWRAPALPGYAGTLTQSGTSISATIGNTFFPARGTLFGHQVILIGTDSRGREQYTISFDSPAHGLLRVDICQPLTTTVTCSVPSGTVVEIIKN